MRDAAAKSAGIMTRRCNLLFVAAVIMARAVGCVLAGQGSGAGDRPIIGYDQTVPQAAFAATEVQRAMLSVGHVAIEDDIDAALKSGSSVRILLVSGSDDKARRIARDLGVTPKSTGWQTYSIRCRKDGNQTTYAVLAADADGAMYGGLDLAEAIRLGTLTGLGDGTGKPEQKAAAIQHLQAALKHWRLYSDAYTRQNRQPVLYNRVGWVDIPGALLKRVEQDIQIAEDWQPGTIKGSVERGADTPFRK